jgi:hypothetical protein
LGIVCVAAIGGVTGIDMEHRNQPPIRRLTLVAVQSWYSSPVPPVSV